MSERIYLRQIQIGPMANYVYLIGDMETREVMVVDPAWDVAAILDVVDRDDMKLTGALVTHFHPDHIGGELFGHNIPGVPQLLEQRPVKIHMHKDEAPYVKRTLGLESSDFTPVDGETTVHVGKIPIRILHTPGHTPGSLCFFVGGNLVSGDTLFIGSCGRVDLPGQQPVGPLLLAHAEAQEAPRRHRALPRPQLRGGEHLDHRQGEEDATSSCASTGSKTSSK